VRYSICIRNNADGSSDKTQVFHDQIEVKQKALEPWASKINGCQSTLDVATGERDMLANKLEDLRKSLEEAEKEVTALNFDKKNKVTILVSDTGRVLTARRTRFSLS
jgi:chromosome segregation ATPase